MALRGRFDQSVDQCQAVQRWRSQPVLTAAEHTGAWAVMTRVLHGQPCSHDCCPSSSIL